MSVQIPGQGKPQANPQAGEDENAKGLISHALQGNMPQPGIKSLPGGCFYIPEGYQPCLRPDFATKSKISHQKEQGISKVFLAFLLSLWYNILVGIYVYRGKTCL